LIIGVDPGSVRVGIAIADLETRFARPLEVIDVKAVDPVERIGALVTEHSATRVIVGRPVGLSGEAGPAVAASEVLVADLRDSLQVPVDEWDERLTTVIAERALRESGVGGRSARAVKDAVAAQIMLQGYLDAHA
jgi:putative Holliday junction resolvase